MALTVGLAVGGGAWAAGAAEKLPQVGQHAPGLAGFALDGKMWSFKRAVKSSASSTPIRAVVVSFFATWCEPCKHGLPIIRKQVAAHPGALMVLVAKQEDAQKVRTHAAALGIADLVVLPDPYNHVSKAYGVQALPRTFVMDASGVVRAVFLDEGPGFSEALGKALDDVVRAPR